MKKLVVNCADDLKIVFDEFSDEYEEYKDEYHFNSAEEFEREWGSRYFVRICDKCKEKYGEALELVGCTIDDYGSGCCSVDGCSETWEDEDTEVFYVYIPSKSAEVRNMKTEDEIRTKMNELIEKVLADFNASVPGKPMSEESKIAYIAASHALGWALGENDM